MKIEGRGLSTSDPIHVIGDEWFITYRSEYLRRCLIVEEVSFHLATYRKMFCFCRPQSSHLYKTSLENKGFCRSYLRTLLL